MEYIIVMDSCGEQTAAMKADECVVPAPLTLQVDDEQIVDDETFDQAVFLIKPVMGATDEGTIIQLDQARGINRALAKMVDYVVENVEDPETKVLGITHCNCPARGEMVKNAILERIKVKDVILLDTAGVSSLYASDGGIIVVI